MMMIVSPLSDFQNLFFPFSRTAMEFLFFAFSIVWIGWTRSPQIRIRTDLNWLNLSIQPVNRSIWKR